MNKMFKEDYYRMTGTEYKFGIKSLIQWFVSHQICILVEKSAR